MPRTGQRHWNAAALLMLSLIERPEGRVRV